ncbi:GlsB/YeaQ/YmgE family stress response membrane protein [Actinomadura sp. 7K507]|uniref:GlsB/YeaQ/YmgE family stress response membrane protein n=1 Tax=Actinomadura sp. 7K507 TaxID=2530365 RepID=UPI00104B4A4D|nr:GlsB/YeaQ/YmgE family stress response membrane protein [Actinomadura sp. 7K507]TDC78178.1 GlsB/YeaQ/YmgE family stress response membrane protein [Actinomadura sp. 7K507]
MLTTILWFIVVGAVIGALARLLVPGRNPIGVLLTILVGIAGAIVGGVIADALGAGTLVAVVFAVVIAALGVAGLTTLNARGDGRRGRGWRPRRRSTF